MPVEASSGEVRRGRRQHARSSASHRLRTNQPLLAGHDLRPASNPAVLVSNDWTSRRHGIKKRGTKTSTRNTRPRETWPQRVGRWFADDVSLRQGAGMHPIRPPLGSIIIQAIPSTSSSSLPVQSHAVPVCWSVTALEPPPLVAAIGCNVFTANFLYQGRDVKMAQKKLQVRKWEPDLSASTLSLANSLFKSGLPPCPADVGIPVGSPSEPGWDETPRLRQGIAEWQACSLPGRLVLGLCYETSRILTWNFRTQSENESISPSQAFSISSDTVKQSRKHRSICSTISDRTRV